MGRPKLNITYKHDGCSLLMYVNGKLAMLPYMSKAMNQRYWRDYRKYSRNELVFEPVEHHILTQLK